MFSILESLPIFMYVRTAGANMSTGGTASTFVSIAGRPGVGLRCVLKRCIQLHVAHNDAAAG